MLVAALLGVPLHKTDGDESLHKKLHPGQPSHQHQQELATPHADISLSKSSDGSPPHILMLMADDLGFVDTGFGGSPLMRTPFLDSLAAEATHLTQFRAPSWCAPSRSSFMTGRHEWEMGSWDASGTDKTNTTLFLPEMLRDAGYRTAVVGKFHFGVRDCKRNHTSGGPFGCGFDHQYGFVGGQSDYYDHLSSWSRDGEELREKGYATELFADEAVRLVKYHATHYKPQPLFMWLAVSAPHVPLQAPDEVIAEFDESVCKSADQTNDQGGNYHVEKGMVDGDDQLTKGGSCLTLRTYAAMILSMDRAFEKAAGALRTEGMLDNTLIAFVSDNGGPATPIIHCNGGLRGGKATVFDGAFRVPGFFHWPARLGTTQKHTSVHAHMVDFMATFAAVAAPDNANLIAAVGASAPTSASLLSELSGAAVARGAAGLVAERAARAARRPKEPRFLSSRRALQPASFADGSLDERTLVLQVGPIGSAVLAGQYKLLMISESCTDASAYDPYVPESSWVGDVQGAQTAGGTTRAGSSGLGTSRAGSMNAFLLGALAAKDTSSLAAATLAAAKLAGVQLRLYDVEADPSEMTDLLPSGEHDEVVGHMLDAYLGSTRTALDAEKQAMDENRLEPMDLTQFFMFNQFFTWNEAIWAEYHTNITCKERDELLTVTESVKL